MEASEAGVRLSRIVMVLREDGKFWQGGWVDERLCGYLRLSERHPSILTLRGKTCPPLWLFVDCTAPFIYREGPGKIMVGMHVDMRDVYARPVIG